MSSDQRKHARRAVSLTARLFIRDDAPMILPCTILDISEGGARVELKASYSLPSQVFLVKDEDENIYECETVWQNAQAAGLMFIDLCARAKRQELLDEIYAAEDAGRFLT